MYENTTRSYRQANILSADPLKLVHICYEGAINSLKMARDAYNDRNYEAKGKSLSQTINIINELNSTLDMEKGGQIAANLRSLYMFMTRALVDADLKKDLTVFDRVIQMLEELDSAWQEIAVENLTGVNCPAPQTIPSVAEKTSMVNRVWSA